MQKILATIQSRKFDEDLKNTYRAIFNKCHSNSPLRQLYFRAALFWKLEFGGGGARLPNSLYGEGVLGLDPEQDFGLISELQRFRETFCGCEVGVQSGVESGSRARGGTHAGSG
jgi:hypothetical protein